LTWTELLSSPPSSPQPPTSTDSAEISPSPKTSEDDKDRKRRPSKFVAAQKSFADTVRQMTKLDFHRGSGAGGQGSPQSGVHWGDGGGSPISGADVNQRVKFGVPLVNCFAGGEVPESLVALFRHLCHVGVKSINIFRKPGNHGDIEKMRRKLNDGKPIDLDKFAIHTVASVVKSFISQIPCGLFGGDGEMRLLAAMETKDLTEQLESIARVIESLPKASQHLVILLFGTLSRTLSHAHENGMTAESLAVSIAPSVITTCTKQPLQIKNAVNLLKLLIQSFPLQHVYGTENISYFATLMETAIRVTEWFKYDFNGPASPSKMRLSRKEKVIQSILDAEAKQHGFHVNRHSVSGDECPTVPSPGTPSDVDAIAEEEEIIDVGRRRSLRPAVVVKDTENGNDEILTIPLNELLEMNRHCEETRHATRFSEVRERQLRRLRTRTDWIQSPASTSTTDLTDAERRRAVTLRRTKSGREASEPPIGTKNSQRFSDGGRRLTEEDNRADSRFYKLVTEFVPKYSN